MCLRWKQQSPNTALRTQIRNSMSPLNLFQHKISDNLNFIHYTEIKALQKNKKKGYQKVNKLSTLGRIKGSLPCHQFFACSLKSPLKGNLQLPWVAQCSALNLSATHSPQPPTYLSLLQTVWFHVTLHLADTVNIHVNPLQSDILLLCSQLNLL